MMENTAPMTHLAAVLGSLGFSPDGPEMQRFLRYRELVLDWNEKVNLTAIKDPEEFEIKHFVDSLAAFGSAPYAAAHSVMDLGTGAGFPGIPLAILSPDKEFLLLDSLNKRIKIINEMAAELGLTNVTAIHGRAEELGKNKQYREHFDLCLSRAVAELPVLSEYCLPFVKIGGYFGAYKSGAAEEEAKNASRAFKVLGGKLGSVADFPFDGFELDHRIIWVKKEKETPARFPRKAGTPGKDPL